MRVKPAFLLVAVCVALLGGLGAPLEARAADTQPMFRMYNRWSGEHFYTASTEERDVLRAQGWTYELVGWTAPVSGAPVHRLYNPYVSGGDHHYTQSEAERDGLVDAGWRYEGVCWYSDPSERAPLYRLYNPYAVTGTHHYTASETERDALCGQGWRYEGVSWHGVRVGGDLTDDDYYAYLIDQLRAKGLMWDDYIVVVNDNTPSMLYVSVGNRAPGKITFAGHYKLYKSSLKIYDMNFRTYI